MAVKVYQHALNVGVADRDKLHRVDISRMRLAAEEQTNFMPHATGKAYLRPGFEDICGTKSDGKAMTIPFIAGVTDSFVLEFTDYVLRVLNTDDDMLVTRAAVVAPITSDTFAAATGWTLAATSGQSSTVTGGELVLKARAHGATASAKQLVATANPGTEHALRVVVTRGPVTLRIGSTDGGAEYLPNGVETQLKTGTHSIAFTPAGSFYVQFSSTAPVDRKVTTCAIEAAGIMELPTLWPLASLPYLKPSQSLDVMFVACDGIRQQRIERRGDTSWSVVDYTVDDGPFLVGKTSAAKLTPSVTEGNGTLTSDIPFFTANHVGALFRIFHEGQRVETYLAGANEVTPEIEVTGVNETNYNERKFTVTIAGTWAGTLRTTRSFDDPDAGYHDFRRETATAVIDITANATFINDDDDDNAIAYYRLGFPASLYTSGEAQVTIVYNGGGGNGICRVVGFTSATQVDIEVLTPFKGKFATANWEEGAWSPIRGYPAASALFDGRLWWEGADDIWASISDAYDSLDDEFVGDAGPLSRSIAVGGRNYGRWLLPLSSLMLGTDARIANARASSLDEILTPDNFGVKSAGRVGASHISPVELSDDRAVFVERAGRDLFEITWSPEKGRYVVNPFSKLNTDLFRTGVLQMDVQILPDQRVWVANESADAVMVLIEPTQEVIAFIPIAMSDCDFLESLCVVPGLGQDRLYASICRQVGGISIRRIEKMALEREALPGDICKVCDSFVEFGAGSANISVPHLIGRTVYGWMDGAPLTDPAITAHGADNALAFVVPGSGIVTLPSVPTIGGILGLRYRGRYKSARLSFGTPDATPMLNNKAVAGLGLLLADYCRSGIKFGTEFDNADRPLRSLPVIGPRGNAAAEIVEGPGEDESMISPGSKIGLDERVCIEAMSPKPLSILSIVLAIEPYGS